MLSVIIMLSIVMPSVVMHSVAGLNVVATKKEDRVGRKSKSESVMVRSVVGLKPGTGSTV
jgi:hypothetical protein